MRISFIPSNVSGVMFFRGWQPAEALRKLGHKVAFLWYNSKLFELHPWELEINRVQQISMDIHMACQWADVVVWMGLHYPPSIEFYKNMRRTHKKPFLVETDDYVYNLPDYNPAQSCYENGGSAVRVFNEQVRLSDGMIVSTPYLKEQYSEMHKNIHVVENTIDLNLWRRQSSPNRQGITLGWMGGASHNKDLLMIKEPLFDILAKYKNVKFKVLHGCPEEYREHPQIEWDKEYKSINEYPKWVIGKKFDIGLAPLVDNSFNRGKSNLRWLEFSAMGIPTIASPVKHFAQSIEHGKTGLLAQTKEDWFKHMELLIHDSRYRKELGENAYKEVKANWNPIKKAKEYYSILKEFKRHAKSN